MAQNLQVDDIVSTTLGPVSFSKGITTPNGVYATAINYAILTTDGFNQVDVTTAASTITITLPTTASSAGRVITIVKVDSGAGSVTISPTAGLINGAASYSLPFQYDLVTLFCDGAGWYVSAGRPAYYEINSASVFTANGAGGGSSSSVSIRMTRIGRTVTIQVPAFSIASTGTSTTNLASSAGIIPTIMRPPENTSGAVMTIINNGSAVATPGTIRITTAGTIQFFRDGIFTTTFANSAGAGTVDAIAFTYNT